MQVLKVYLSEREFAKPMRRHPRYCRLTVTAQRKSFACLLIPVGCSRDVY
jgi:hypothetical protein